MDYDGANNQFLTDASSIGLAPSISPTGGPRVLYTSYETGFPQIFDLNVGSSQAGPSGAGWGDTIDLRCPATGPKGARLSIRSPRAATPTSTVSTPPRAIAGG